MSVASVYPNSRGLGQGYQYDSLDDFSSQNYSEPTVLSIEEIRLQLYSCFTCGVSWLQDHVCLDCVECGGYSLHRPCPQCEGQCGALWKRDLTMSHACGKSRWIGECQQETTKSKSNTSNLPTKELDSIVCTEMTKLTLSS